MSFEITVDQLSIVQDLNKMSLQDPFLIANLAETKSSGGHIGGNNTNGFSTNSSTGQDNSYNIGYNNGSRGRGGKNKGRGGFRFNNNNKPTCQICGKFGHSVAVCYFRTDMKYMGTQQNIPPPP
ncbi:hypothetical protein Scep_023635 [Stephania cephalantha]|uniref:Uncharacterized protein n=1 Tax=Stephania cephalantha TaxID=152367 RepID=A0AAP0EXS7_9MAGN